MNLSNINDNRHFWKTAKPFLSDHHFSPAILAFLHPL